MVFHDSSELLCAENPLIEADFGAEVWWNLLLDCKIEIDLEFGIGGESESFGFAINVDGGLSMVKRRNDARLKITKKHSHL